MNAGLNPADAARLAGWPTPTANNGDKGLQSVSGEFPERIGSDSKFDNGMDDTVSVGRNEGGNWDHEGDVGQQFATDVQRWWRQAD